MAPLQGAFFMRLVLFLFNGSWWKIGLSRLRFVAVGFRGRRVIVVVGKYDGGLRATGGKSKTLILVIPDLIGNPF